MTDQFKHLLNGRSYNWHHRSKTSAHFVSGCEEARVVLKGLFHQLTEAVEQGEQLLHILLRVLQRARKSIIITMTLKRFLGRTSFFPFTSLFLPVCLCVNKDKSELCPRQDSKEDERREMLILLASSSPEL